MGQTWTQTQITHWYGNATILPCDPPICSFKFKGFKSECVYFDWNCLALMSIQTMLTKCTFNLCKHCNIKESSLSGLKSSRLHLQYCSLWLAESDCQFSTRITGNILAWNGLSEWPSTSCIAFFIFCNNEKMRIKVVRTISASNCHNFYFTLISLYI